jgi:Bacterial SH3 domain
VPNARHKRSKGPQYARHGATLALAVAILAAVPVGVAAWPERDELPSVEPIRAVADSQRSPSISRGLSQRPPVPSASSSPTPTPTTPAPATATPTPTAEPTVVGQLYVTTSLNVRAAPSRDAEVLTVLDRGAEVGLTATTDGPWVQIAYADGLAWVNGDYLSETEPTAEPEPSGSTISAAECASGSAVENGLTPDAIRVHRAVCAEFPAVTSYGGVRSGGGEHSVGRALDIMVSSSSLGDAIAAFVRSNYAALGVSEVIWSQQIWTVERAGDGWRWMADRGSATANHYDHVHVTVYGDAGG